MRKIIWVVLLAVAPLSAFCDAYTKLERTGEIIQIPYKLSLRQIEDAIIDGSMRKGWEPKKLSDGTIQDTLHIRSHIAVVHVVYTAESFRIDYADSTNLVFSGENSTSRYQIAQGMNTSAAGINSTLVKDADGERIHKNYYVWTKNLANYIMQSLATENQLSRAANYRSAGESVPNKLRELEALRKDGIISAEEYQKKKQQLLDQF